MKILSLFLDKVLSLGWTYYVSYVKVNIGGKLSKPVIVPFEIRINRFTKRVQKVTHNVAHNGGLFDIIHYKNLDRVPNSKFTRVTSKRKKIPGETPRRLIKGEDY